MEIEIIRRSKRMRPKGFIDYVREKSKEKYIDLGN